MDISVTKFKAHCLDLIRQVENGGEPLTIQRRGKKVARVVPIQAHEKELKPWERLQALSAGTVCLFKDDESVLRDEDFEALR